MKRKVVSNELTPLDRRVLADLERFEGLPLSAEQLAIGIDSPTRSAQRSTKKLFDLGLIDRDPPISRTQCYAYRAKRGSE